MPPIYRTPALSFKEEIRAKVDGAKNKDAENVREVINTRSSEKHLLFYVVEKEWMTSFAVFLDDHQQYTHRHICNDSLIETFVTSKIIPLEEYSPTKFNSLYADDDLHIIPSEKAREKSMVTPSRKQLKKGLVLGKDFVLVGSALWTYLSSTFSVDTVLSFETRFLSSEEKETFINKVAADTSDLVVQVYENYCIPVPLSGQFDYAVSDDNQAQLISKDNGSSDDMIPFEDTEVSYNEDEPMPVLLLPPSTTYEQTNESMSVTTDSFSTVRKRKRYSAGLGNLGNTCFMNATLQCLAHTWPLRQYFLSGQFQEDLNRENPLGTGGELAMEFAKLLQEMWGLTNESDSGRRPVGLYSTNYNKPWSSSSTYSSVVYPRSFKYALGKHAEQFLGYDQHDSQELATFLLDALHEDTNRVTKKPYIEKPEQGELETDDEAAAKSWELHLKRENSRVLENFIGQVKSRVECPKPGCGRVSTTFDPFMYLSVPIPGVTNRSISFVYVPLNRTIQAKEFHVVVNKTANVMQLRQVIATTLNQYAFEEPVCFEDLVVTEVYSNQVYLFFRDDQLLSDVRDLDKIFVYRVHPKIALSTELSDGNQMQTPYLPLDEATVKDLSVDDKWRSVLERYLKQPLSLTHFLNPKRSSLEERLQFLEKAKFFLERCFKTPECVAYRRNWERKTNGDKENYGGHSLKPLVDSTRDEINDQDELSLEERCINSGTFKGMRSADDVAILEFCARKLHHKLCIDNEAPREIQVVFMKPMHTYYPKYEAFGYPLVLRITPALTIFDLRKVLADIISPFIVEGENIEGKIDHSMQDDIIESATTLSQISLNIMRQVQLQYNRESSSTKYFNRTLGSVTHSDDNTSRYVTSQALASPSDDAELNSVLDIVGDHGKVLVSFPEYIISHKLVVQNMFQYESGRTMQDGSSVEEKTTTVLQCIKKYCQKEQLEESDMWYCDRCKEHVPAWKQIGLYRLPPILIVHLKRFHFSAHSHRRSKIETPIDFPLVGLDLRDEAKTWLEGEEPIYDCYALTNHFGGLGGGHYTAFAHNDDGEWCGFDDCRVTTGLSTSSIVTPAAYVLYYKRRDVTLPSDSSVVENSSLKMDFDDERIFGSEVSMEKSSPSEEAFPAESSSLDNEPTDDRDEFTNLYTV